jgi:hypothetical protein
VTTQGLSRIAGGIAIVAVLVVSGMVAWSVLRQQDPDPVVQQVEAPPRVGEARRLGDLTGYVGRVDPDAHTLVVAANPLGTDPVMLIVANDAAVTVHGKRGGLGDLSKNMPVRVFYEVRNEVKHVTSIVAERPQASAPSAAERKPAAEAKPAPEAKPPSEAKPAAEPKPVAEPKPAPTPTTPQAKAPVETKVPIETKPPAEVRSAAPPVARPTPPPAPEVTAVTPKPAAPPAATTTPPRPTAPPVAQPPVTSPRAPAPSPAERDDDGSAAVDWLLKGSGRH